MKLASFNRGGHAGVGAVDTARGEILDLAKASELRLGQRHPAFASMLALIDSASPGLDAARRLAARWPAEAAMPLAFVLYAGEVIGSGTVGTGCGLELGKRLKHGDIVELEIENIGVLRNRVLKP
jgi:hypothetical protein